MFEEVNDKVSNQDEEWRALAAQFEAGGKNLHNRGCQHEPSAQGHKVLEIRAVPVFLNNDGAAKNIGRSRGEPKQNAEEDRMHVAGG